MNSGARAARARRVVCRAILIVGIVMALSACQPNPTSSRIGPVQLMVGRVRSLFTPKPPEHRCLVSLGRSRDDLPGAVGKQVAGLGSGANQTVDWHGVFYDAALAAGVRKPNVSVEVGKSYDSVVLVAVDWCYGLSGYDLYVVDPGVDTWRVAENPGATAPPEIRWLGDAWAVITDFGSGLHLVRLELVARQNGEWAVIYRSDDDSSIEQLVWGSPTVPSFTFEDGYRRMRVVWQTGPEWLTVETVYEWQDGRYVQVEEKEPGE